MGGYYFHNGAEYLLLCVLIVTLLVYDNIYIQILASCATILAIILVIFYPSDFFSDNYVPVQRVMFNFVSAISFLLIIIAVFKDIQYAYQKKIAEQHAQLKQINGTMENIFSIIAHDIREPLTSVYDMLSLFEKNIITSQTAHENASLIKLRITLLNDALDNLLRWGGRNMQGTTIQRTDVCIDALYEEVYQFLMPQAKRKAIIWEENIEKNLIAYIDRDQILIVFRNILSNAIKYSHFGGTIHFSAMRNHGKVFIEIRDTGIGIPQDQLSSLFNYIQVPAHGTQGERGSGFGLFLSRELLQQNDGDCSVRSQPNMGSVFSISLPLSKKTHVP
ncbi:sensor histidine kinase [Sphingobacterium chuzhouense]|nr:HAMP domain-containing sensor histidine kinase [Sphingobacterium chuzhouense]